MLPISELTFCWICEICSFAFAKILSSPLANFERLMYTVFNNIYLVLVPLLLLFYLTKSASAKRESLNLLFVLHTLLPILLLLSLAIYAGELFYAWYGQNPYEFYVYRQGIIFPLYLGYILLLVPLVFLWRKLRTIRWLILLNYLIMARDIYRELYFSFSKDYLASSWSKTNEQRWEELVSVAIMLFVLALLYFLLHKTKKLPYPSLFLK
jgi:hypothetical protein